MLKNIYYKNMSNGLNHYHDTDYMWLKDNLAIRADHANYHSYWIGYKMLIEKMRRSC